MTEPIIPMPVWTLSATMSLLIGIPAGLYALYAAWHDLRWRRRVRWVATRRQQQRYTGD